MRQELRCRHRLRTSMSQIYHQHVPVLSGSKHWARAAAAETSTTKTLLASRRRYRRSRRRWTDDYRVPFLQYPRLGDPAPEMIQRSKKRGVGAWSPDDFKMQLVSGRSAFHPNHSSSITGCRPKVSRLRGRPGWKPPPERAFASPETTCKNTRASFGWQASGDARKQIAADRHSSTLASLPTDWTGDAAVVSIELGSQPIVMMMGGRAARLTEKRPAVEFDRTPPRGSEIALVASKSSPLATSVDSFSRTAAMRLP